MGWFAIACVCGFLGYRCWGWTSDGFAHREVAGAEILYVVVAAGVVFAILVLWASGSLLGLLLGIAIGFPLYWGWRSLSNWLLRKFHFAGGYAAAISAGIGVTIVIAGIDLWAFWLQQTRTPGQAADGLQLGSVVRFLLGVILGIGLGFLGRWGRQSISDRPGPKHQITSDNAETLSGVIGFAIVLAGLVLWTIGSQNASTLGQVADALQHGRVARFLFGLVLGVGAAFVMAERSRVQSSNSGTLENPAKLVSAALGAEDPDVAPAGVDPPRIAELGSRPGGNGVSPRDSSKSELPMAWIVSTGLAIVILALVAPHLDDWLHRLSGFKSPYVELQLASASTHKISVEEGEEVLLSTDSLSYLSLYDSKIQQDIDYLTKYGQEVPKRDKIVASAIRLLPTFTTIVGPITKCVQTAIDHEWLSLDSARRILRPTADILEEIIFAGDTLSAGQALMAKNDQFWRLVLDCRTWLLRPSKKKTA